MSATLHTTDRSRAARPGFQALLWGLALSAMGLLCLPQVRMAWLPAEETQVVWIALRYPGAAPFQVEQLVTAPVESALSQLANVEQLDSYSLPGRALIRLTYATGVAVGQQEPRLRGELRRLRNRLPAAVSTPLLSFVSPDSEERSSLRYAIQAPEGMPLHRPYVARYLDQRSQPIPGVMDQGLEGQGEAALLLTITPEQLARRALTYRHIEQWLQQSYAQRSLGRGGADRQGPAIVQAGEAPSLTQLLELPVLLSGRSLPLGNLATLRQIPLPSREEVQLDGRPVLYLQFDLDPQAQLLSHVQVLQADMAALETALPEGRRIRCVQDPTAQLRQELMAQASRLGWTSLAVLLGLWLWAWSLRYAMVAGFGLLVSLGLATLGVYGLGVQVHLYSLSALSVALGIMVDQTVLVGDAVRRGEPIRKLALPLAAASLTTVGSLLPLLGLSRSHWGSLLDFGALLAICLGNSLLVALWIMPAMMRGLPRAVARPGRRQNRRLSRWLGWLLRLLRRTRWGWRVGLLLLIGLPLTWLSPRLEGLGGLSQDFLEDLQHHFYWAPPEAPALRVEITFPVPPPRRQIKALIRPLVDRFRALPTGWIDQVDTRLRANGEVNLRVAFLPQALRGGQAEAVKGMVMRYAVEHDGANWKVSGIGEGLSTGMANQHAFEVVLKGYHYQQLDSLVGAVTARLASNDRISSINPHALGASWQREEYGYAVGFHPALAAEARPDWVDQAQRFSQLASPAAPLLLPEGSAKRRYPLLLKAPDFEDTRLHTWLESRAPTGRFPSVRDGIRLHLEPLPKAIVRENRSYVRRISFEYAGSHAFGKRWAEAELARMTFDWPAGFEAELFVRKGLPLEERQNLRWVGLGVLLIIWLICSVLFDSLVDGLRMVEAIPLALLGILLTHQLGLAPLNEGAVAAVVLVMGLSVNNSILLLAGLKALPSHDWASARQAVAHKFRPIGLATLSTVAGLFPILIAGPDTGFWYSLAVFTTGGLTVGTLLLLFVWWPFWMKGCSAGRG